MLGGGVPKACERSSGGLDTVEASGEDTDTGWPTRGLTDIAADVGDPAGDLAERGRCTEVYALGFAEGDGRIDLVAREFLESAAFRLGAGEELDAFES